MKLHDAFRVHQDHLLSDWRKHICKSCCTISTLIILSRCKNPASLVSLSVIHIVLHLSPSSLPPVELQHLFCERCQEVLTVHSQRSDVQHRKVSWKLLEQRPTTCIPHLPRGTRRRRRDEEETDRTRKTRHSEEETR